MGFVCECGYHEVWAQAVYLLANGETTRLPRQEDEVVKTLCRWCGSPGGRELEREEKAKGNGNPFVAKSAGKK